MHHLVAPAQHTEASAKGLVVERVSKERVVEGIMLWESEQTSGVSLCWGEFRVEQMSLESVQRMQRKLPKICKKTSR